MSDDRLRDGVTGEAPGSLPPLARSPDQANSEAGESRLPQPPTAAILPEPAGNQEPSLGANPDSGRSPAAMPFPTDVTQSAQMPMTPPGPGTWSYPQPGFVNWGYGSAPGQGWPQASGAPPAAGWPPNPGWPPPAYGWPPAYGQAPVWPYPTSYGAAGYAPPWGSAQPGTLEPPGRFHPVRPARPIASLAGRAAPRLYAAGWLLTVGGLALLVTLLAAAFAGLTAGAGPLATVALLEISLLATGAGSVAAGLAQGSQRRADGWQDYFGASPFLGLVAWLALSNAAALLLLVALDALALTPPTSASTLLVLLVNVAGYIGVVHLLAVRPGALSWSDIARPRHLALDPSDWFEPSAWGVGALQTGGQKAGRLIADAALGFGLAIPALIVTLILAGVLTTLLGMNNVSYESPIPITTDWDLWINLLSVAILAPIGEEIFFRGFTTNVWARSLTRQSAVMRAAIFFAAIHVINVDIPGQFDLSILIRAAFLAVAVRIPVAWGLAWIYARRRSIYASAALHMTYNGALILLVWWASHYVPGQ